MAEKEDNQQPTVRRGRPPQCTSHNSAVNKSSGETYQRYNPLLGCFEDVTDPSAPLQKRPIVPLSANRRFASQFMANHRSRLRLMTNQRGRGQPATNQCGRGQPATNQRVQGQSVTNQRARAARGSALNRRVVVKGNERQAKPSAVPSNLSKSPQNSRLTKWIGRPSRPRSQHLSVVPHHQTGTDGATGAVIGGSTRLVLQMPDGAAEGDGQLVLQVPEGMEGQDLLLEDGEGGRVLVRIPTAEPLQQQPQQPPQQLQQQLVSQDTDSSRLTLKVRPPPELGDQQRLVLTDEDRDVMVQALQRLHSSQHQHQQQRLLPREDHDQHHLQRLLPREDHDQHQLQRLPRGEHAGIHGHQYIVQDTGATQQEPAVQEPCTSQEVTTLVLRQPPHHEAVEQPPQRILQQESELHQTGSQLYPEEHTVLHQDQSASLMLQQDINVQQVVPQDHDQLEQDEGVGLEDGSQKLILEEEDGSQLILQVPAGSEGQDLVLEEPDGRQIVIRVPERTGSGVVRLRLCRGDAAAQQEHDDYSEYLNSADAANDASAGSNVEQGLPHDEQQPQDQPVREVTDVQPPEVPHVQHEQRVEEVAPESVVGDALPPSTDVYRRGAPLQERGSEVDNASTSSDAENLDRNDMTNNSTTAHHANSTSIAPEMSDSRNSSVGAIVEHLITVYSSHNDESSKATILGRDPTKYAMTNQSFETSEPVKDKFTRQPQSSSSTLNAVTHPIDDGGAESRSHVMYDPVKDVPKAMEETSSFPHQLTVTDAPIESAHHAPEQVSSLPHQPDVSEDPTEDIPQTVEQVTSPPHEVMEVIDYVAGLEAAKKAVDDDAVRRVEVPSEPVGGGSSVVTNAQTGANIEDENNSVMIDTNEENIPGEGNTPDVIQEPHTDIEPNHPQLSQDPKEVPDDTHPNESQREMDTHSLGIQEPSAADEAPNTITEPSTSASASSHAQETPPACVVCGETPAYGSLSPIESARTKQTDAPVVGFLREVLQREFVVDEGGGMCVSCEMLVNHAEKPGRLQKSAVVHLRNIVALKRGEALVEAPLPEPPPLAEEPAKTAVKRRSEEAESTDEDVLIPKRKRGGVSGLVRRRGSQLHSTIIAQEISACSSGFNKPTLADGDEDDESSTCIDTPSQVVDTPPCDTPSRHVPSSQILKDEVCDKTSPVADRFSHDPSSKCHIPRKGTIAARLLADLPGRKKNIMSAVTEGEKLGRVEQSGGSTEAVEAQETDTLREEDTSQDLHIHIQAEDEADDDGEDEDDEMKLPPTRRTTSGRLSRAPRAWSPDVITNAERLQMKKASEPTLTPSGKMRGRPRKYGYYMSAPELVTLQKRAMAVRTRVAKPRKTVGYPAVKITKVPIPNVNSFAKISAANPDRVNIHQTVPNVGRFENATSLEGDVERALAIMMRDDAVDGVSGHGSDVADVHRHDEAVRLHHSSQPTRSSGPNIDINQDVSSLSTASRPSVTEGAVQDSVETLELSVVNIHTSSDPRENLELQLTSPKLVCKDAANLAHRGSVGTEIVEITCEADDPDVETLQLCVTEGEGGDEPELKICEEKSEGVPKEADASISGTQTAVLNVLRTSGGELELYRLIQTEEATPIENAGFRIEGERTDQLTEVENTGDHPMAAEDLVLVPAAAIERGRGWRRGSSQKASPKKTYPTRTHAARNTYRTRARR